MILYTLDRLNYWRTLRGYSIRKLAELSKVNPSTVWNIEKYNRPTYGPTARKLAEGLGVKVTDLYAQAATDLTLTVLTIQEETYKKHTALIKPARPTRAKDKVKTVISFWVIEKDQEEGDPFNVGSLTEAERLKARLGGQHQARVYEAASKFEAWELHRQFLIRVARGHDAW